MEFGLLSGLSEPDRRRVLTEARRRRFARDEVVFHEGDPAHSLHLIRSGRVAVRVTNARGDVATLTVLGPGSSFGELSLVEPDSNRSGTVVALEPTETMSLYRDDVDRLRREHPSLDQLIIDVLVDQVRRLTGLVQEAYFVPADQRVLRRLATLARVYADGSGPVTVPVSQESLASMAGTTRPTANRVLRAAQRDGLITLGRARVVIVDSDRLDAQAGH